MTGSHEQGRGWQSFGRRHQKAERHCLSSVRTAVAVDCVRLASSQTELWTELASKLDYVLWEGLELGEFDIGPD